jgi:DNA (cytosine-5)-methyltransferase 1
MTVVWQSEIDPYACRVLAKHWPHVPNLGDITTVDWGTVEPVDVVCGGYPCQPFSLAGVRAGEGDPRHLWPHFARAVRHLRPRYTLLENVPGHLSLGFGRVLGDLAELGYDCEWECIPAAAVGAPHLRYRVLVVAYPHGESEPVLAINGDTRQAIVVPRSVADASVARLEGQRLSERSTALRGVVADTDEHQHEGGASALRWQTATDLLPDTDPSGRDGWPRQLGTGRRREPADGGWWAVEPDVGRVAHGIPNRVDRLRCLGNAVVPQVAEWIGRRLMEAQR